jgi:hypothetical protein
MPSSPAPSSTGTLTLALTSSVREGGPDLGVPPSSRPSVARGEDTERSDIDLMVGVAPGVGLFGLARCQHELQSILRAPVDLVPAGDLKIGIERSVRIDAQPI